MAPMVAVNPNATTATAQDVATAAYSTTTRVLC